MRTIAIIDDDNEQIAMLLHTYLTKEKVQKRIQKVKDEYSGCWTYDDIYDEFMDDCEILYIDDEVRI